MSGSKHPKRDAHVHWVKPITNKSREPFPYRVQGVAPGALEAQGTDAVITLHLLVPGRTIALQAGRRKTSHYLDCVLISK
jgi:hypothetical protein